jgi:hypothetical protein
MSQEPTFERFLDAVRGTNPFKSFRITDPDADEPTVESIHQAAFAKLVRVVNDAAKTPTSVGVLLIGAPGVGKSHMLARLFQWAREDRATVVYLHNILASPERMLRYVLSATVSELVGRSGYAQSRLYAILNRALTKTGAMKGFKPGTKGVEVRREALHHLGRDLDQRGDVIPVLNAFLAGTTLGSLGDAAAEERARASVLWLSGEALDPDEAELIDLPRSAEGSTLADDAAVAHVLDVVSRLCALAELPLVLCLDQVDNLPKDTVEALTSYAHALLDKTKNLVLIVSGVKQSMLAMRTEQVIPAASWDRIAERTLELHMISPDEARAILERRLDATLAGFQEHGVLEVIAARKKDGLFPLGGAWLKERLGSVVELRPRDVILWARDRWEAQQEQLEAVGGRRWIDEWQADSREKKQPDVPLAELVDAEVKKKLVEGVQRRELSRASLPPDADNLANLTYRLLAEVKGHTGYTLVGIDRVAAKKRAPAPAYQLVATEKRADGVLVTSGVTFLCAPNGKGVWAPLSRVADDEQPPDHRILVTDDERRPLKLGGAGKAAYDKLCKAGRERFLHIRLAFPGHAELDSLVGLLGAARSQDLEVEHPRGQYRKVTEAEVVASFHRQSLLLAHPVLRELLTEEAVIDGNHKLPEGTWDLQRTREHIMAELSWRMGLMAKELAQIFAMRQKLADGRFAGLWAHVKKAVQTLHAEGKIHATAQDDDIFVQLRSKK